MKNYYRTKRLSLLVTLLGITYGFLIGNTFISDWDNIKRSFMEGAERASSMGPGSIVKKSKSYHLSLKLKDGIAAYPDSMLNLKNHTILPSINKNVIAFNPPQKRSIHSLWAGTLSFVLALLVLITYILIPFHFYRLIGLIKKGIIFERENIRLIRYLGIELLIIYFGNVLFNFLSYKNDLSLFSFSNYEIQMDSMDAIWLLFGIVVLLVAEILSRAIALKEEQELTI